ncbi:MAG: hypothetical protein ACI8RZ_004044, partial [Myxococcota bacterium]
MAATSIIELFGSMRPRNAAVAADVVVIAAALLDVVRQEAIRGGQSLSAPIVVLANVLPHDLVMAIAAAAVAAIAAAVVVTAAAVVAAATAAAGEIAAVV